MGSLVVSATLEHRDRAPDKRLTYAHIGLARSVDHARELADAFLLGLTYDEAEITVKGFGPGAGTVFVVTPHATLS